MTDHGNQLDRNALGQTGMNVLLNVARIRQARGLSYAQLSELLTQNGRPIPTLGLSRIEKGKRRVDADDLVALAIALNVNPNSLLFPNSEDPDISAPMTGSRDAFSLADIWAWAQGRTFLHHSDVPEELQAELAVLESKFTEYKYFSLAIPKKQGSPD